MDDDANSSIALYCRGLVKNYEDVRALDGLDLEVRVGECFGLLGPNGAGKTTALEIIEGLTRQDAGDVELLGFRWGRGHDQVLRERLGVQLQEAQLADKLTVLEVVRLFRSFYRRGRAVDEVIGTVGLNSKRNGRVHQLSGGQKQRLALACALVSDPEILFLDEPTTGLDPQARLRVWEVVEGVKQQGTTVVLTTHYMEEAARLCGRVAIVDAGRAVSVGSPAALVDSLGAEHVVELSTTPVLDAQQISGLPGVTGTRPADRGRTVLRMGNSEAGLPDLIAALDGLGARVDSMSVKKPSLEDVFVHLTGKGLRDG